jgi:hypothetical protein
MMLEPRQQERLQSLKAGLFGAGAIALFIPLPLILAPLWLPSPSLVSVSSLFHGVAATLAGFLFGVTYRYTVRQDPNPQLKSGTVGAFAFVRGLAIAEHWLADRWHPWVVAIGFAESIGMFAIAALVLELAMQQGWLERCQTPE